MKCQSFYYDKGASLMINLDIEIENLVFVLTGSFEFQNYQSLNMIKKMKIDKKNDKLIQAIKRK
ncbi:hypothetical protein BpHYR1_041778 [Brachionus plicatilis]|uniref:Uncharacterized protein n=1 Tax=Brachionus plicatilis TaxID=10195 RepID=A0A3M7PP93_BRAPC|nr:hypothetical protein BpHYR1_041778 [Brachionus plicatilis]